MTSFRVLTQSLGGGALARRVIEGTTPKGWYPTPPAGAAAWRDRARRIAANAPASWLDRLTPALDARGVAAARLERASAGGIVVTTGQQPGLFGGPIYTWTKALSALALADEIERATGIAAAPVFWAATDDADFAEASVTHVAVTGGLRTLRLPPPPSALQGRAMAELPLGNVELLLEALADGAGSTIYPEALGAVGTAYVPRETIGGAYLRLLRGILAPLGVAVLDASHPATREATMPVLREALARSANIAERVAERDAELRSSGFTPQVESIAGLSLVFGATPDGKERIRVDQAGRAAEAAPDGTLGPNVLLRPVVERAILPTVAYLAGPGELAYFAQVGVVAAALSIDAPLALPRWSGTIVEPHVQRLLDRYGVRQEELADVHAIEASIARERMPERVAKALAALRRAIDDHSAMLTGASDDAGVPPRSVEGTRRALHHDIVRLERRFLAATKRQSAAAMRDVATMAAALYPAGARQERMLNFVPLLARQGPALLDALLDAARAHAAALVHGTVATGSGALASRPEGDASAVPGSPA